MEAHEIRNAAGEMLTDAQRNLKYNVIEAASQTAERQLLNHIDMLMDLQEKLTAQLREATLSAREAGSSWADVAGHLGMTRQAAHQKYGQKRETAEAPMPGQESLTDQLRDDETQTFTPEEEAEGTKALAALQAVDARKRMDEDLAAIAAEHVARAAAKQEVKKFGFKDNEFKYRKGHRTMSYIVVDRATGTELGMVYRDSGTTWAARDMHDQQVLSDYPGSRDTAASSLRR